MPGFAYGGEHGATYGGDNGSVYSTPLPRQVKNLVVAATRASEADLTWSAAGGATEYVVYQAESSGTTTEDYTEVATTTNTNATVTGLENGEQYYFRVAGRNNVGEGPLSTEVDATADLPPTEITAMGGTTVRELTLTLDPQDNSTDGGIDIYRSTDGTLGTTVATGLAPGTTSYTDTGLDDGREYFYTVRRVTDHAQTDGTRVAATTILPDEDAPVLGKGVEDEVAVDRESAPTNYGSVRIQIRETGQSSWDASATGFGEFVGAFDTLSMEFVGRLDGEEYEVRARTETPNTTGAWTEPVAITTKFPGATDVTVTAISETEVELAWTDNADNEDGQYIVRERRGPDGSWWFEQIVGDAGPNTEAYTDDTAPPDTEFRYRVRPYTEHTSADSNTDQATTDDLGLPRIRVPVSGPFVQIDHPDGDTLSPTVTDYDWSPNVNERPSVEITVPESDRWDELTGQPMRVWIDGTQLPIDTLAGTRTTTGDRGSRTVLEGSGGTQLDDYIDDIQFDERENHLAAEDLITENTDYAANVDDPATDTRSDVLMLSASGASLEDDLLDPLEATDPLQIEQVDGISRLQTGWFFEAERADESNVATYFADNEGNGGAWSGNRAVRLDSPGDYIEFDFRNDHTIPQGEAEFEMLRAAIGGNNPAFDVSFNGDVVESIPADALANVTTDEFDLSWGVGFTLNPDADLEPGFHSVRVEVTQSGSDYMTVDAAHARDTRDSFTFDDEPVDGVIQGPEEYPGTVDIVLDDITSVEQVIAGELSVAMSNTEGGQAVAISNDQGETWIEATNSETVSGAFASATQQIRARVSLSGYSADPTTSPAQGDAGQSVDEIGLRADLEDTPVLLDKQYRDRLSNVLSKIADDGRMVWELRRDPDADPLDETGMIVEWTQIGQRTRESAAPATNLETRTTIEDAYERVVVFGRSKGVEGETFSQSAGSSLTSIGDEWVVPDSERIYDPDTEEVFERGTDYRMEWDVGGLDILDGGDMSTGTTYAADYEFKHRGEATTPTVDPAEARTVGRTIAGATSDRECNQLALSILKDVQDAQVEATITLVEPAPDVPLVEAISHPRLPEGAQEIRGVERSSTSEREYRLANRPSADETIDAIREDIQSLSDVV